MMKMNEQIKAEDQGTGSVVTPKLVWCFKRSAWHGTQPAQQDLLGGVSDPQPVEAVHLPSEDTENCVWTTVCKKLISLRQNSSFQTVNLSINVTHVVV